MFQDLFVCSEQNLLGCQIVWSSPESRVVPPSVIGFFYQHILVKPFTTV